MLKRRQLIHAGLTGAIATGLASTAPSVLASPSTIQKPRRLRQGDRVGIVSPASATFLYDELRIVSEAIAALGLVPHLASHVLNRYGYLGGTDEERAADINEMFANPDIAAVLPIRGGWGCSRILPYLNYDLIRQNPKVLVGFSDITALLLGIYAQTGLVTFHGPNGLTGWRRAQTDWFRRVLFDGQAMTFQNFPDPGDGDRLMTVNHRIQTLVPGRAIGRLIGGNLSVISGIVGSPYVPDMTGAILFLEDIGETIYRLDRMITHLKLAGLLDGLAGLIFGQCINCRPDQSYGSLTLDQVIQDHIQPLGIPAWSGALIGHIETIVTLPIGLEVEIDAAAGSIRMTTPAVL